jgi:hypothetical protein
VSGDGIAPYEGPWQVAAGTPGNERFGALLKNLRKRSGLSVQELAAQAEVHVSFVRGIERGAQAPSLARAHPLLAGISEQDRIQWIDSDECDLVIRDPETEGEVAFEFRAKVKGQNKRPDVDPLAGVRAGLMVFVEALQAVRQSLPAGGDPLAEPRAALMALNEAVPGLVPPQIAATGGSLADDVPNGGEDGLRRSVADEAAFGRVVRLLASADEEMLRRVETLLRGEAEPRPSGS